MSNKWIKKDDTVVLLAGNQRGSTGKVVARIKDAVIIEGINRRKKHVKPRTKNGSSEIIEKEMPIHISNVALANSAGKPIFVKVRPGKKEGRELFYIEEGKEVVHRKLL